MTQFNSKDMHMFSTLAYQKDPPNVVCIDATQSFFATDAQAIVKTYPATQTCVIAFRGTDSGSDWGYDTIITTKRCVGSAQLFDVHLGFLLQFMSLCEKLREYVAECTTLYLTGH